MSSSLIECPISKVPYDILREIFIHCLPRYRLRGRQPDVTITPMLLCQICSSWRMVALTSATLWSHLYFHLSVRKQSYRRPGRLASDWTIPENEYSFLMWWKKNQRSMAPSLRLNLDLSCVKGFKYPEIDLGPAGMISFFEYVSSAHYFETDALYWCVLEERIKYGYPIVFPNPHTMVTLGHETDYTSFYDIQISFLPNPILSSLRHLSIHDDIQPYYSVIPNCWSALTHLSLTYVVISLQFWFPLIRAVPELQWGNFDLWELSSYDYVRPTNCTLHHLSTLFVAICGIDDASNRECPLSILFTNLHLPTLKNLRLLTDEKLWRDQRAIPELYSVLHSTPAITTLTLGYIFLSLEYNTYSEVILPALRDVEPIWSHAPCLVHLRLEVMENNHHSQAQVDKASQDTLIRNILHCDTPWLALESPTCPIRKITMVDMRLSAHRSNDFVNSAMSIIQKHPENIPNTNVIFQVVSEEENQSAAEVWNE